MLVVQSVTSKKTASVVSKLKTKRFPFYIINYRMQKNAKRISKFWHDRPQSVIDSAIYWTEYVARHGTSPPSLPAKHNTWFESTLIDVYIIAVSLFLLLIYVFYILVNFFIIIVIKLLKRILGSIKLKKE